MLSGGQVPLTDIRPRQYQRPLGDLRSLITSIRIHGMVVPIVVDDGYEVIDGERRVAVAQALGWRTIPCVATGNYDTIVAQLKETKTRTEELGLPSLPMTPRTMCEFLDNVDRLYPYKHNRIIQPPLNLNRISRTVKADVAEILGVDWTRLRIYRSIFGMYERAPLEWPDRAEHVQGLIHAWETGADPGLTAYGTRTRIYEAIHPSNRKATSQRGLIPRADRPPKEPRVRRRVPPELTVEDTVGLARSQQLRIDNVLSTLLGTANGLGTMALSQHIDPEQFHEWLDKYSEISVMWHRFGKHLRAAINRTSATEPEESNP